MELGKSMKYLNVNFETQKKGLEKVSFLSIEFLFSFEKRIFMAKIGRIIARLPWPIKLITKVMIFLKRAFLFFSSHC